MANRYSRAKASGKVGLGLLRGLRRAAAVDAPSLRPTVAGSVVSGGLKAGYAGAAAQKVEERAGQDGYVLVGVIFLVFLVMVALSIAVPRMAASIERDREVEMQHREKQYVRAIKLYYKKMGGYPPTLEALEKQNDLRFLRKKYKDPITGKADWKPIQFGQNKMPTVYGFFGQPMAGSSMGGTAGMAGGSSLGSLGGSTLGSSSGSTFGSTSSGSTFGSTSSGTSSGSTDSSGSSGSSGSSASGSTSGSGSSSGSSSGSGSGSGSDSSSGSSSGFGGSGQTYGGAGIIGIESTSTKKSILEYHKKQHFNEWEFVYDPMQDQVLMGSSNLGSASGMSSSGMSTAGSISNQQNNSGSTSTSSQQQQTTSPQ